jgi:hypothetical protein
MSCVIIVLLCASVMLIRNSRSEHGAILLESPEPDSMYPFYFSAAFTHPADPIGDRPKSRVVLPFLYNAWAGTTLMCYKKNGTGPRISLSTSHGYGAGQYSSMEIDHGGNLMELLLFSYRSQEFLYKVSDNGDVLREFRGRLGWLEETSSPLYEKSPRALDRSLSQITAALQELQNTDVSWKPRRRLAWLRLYLRLGTEKELGKRQMQKLAAQHQERLLATMTQMRGILELN